MLNDKITFLPYTKRDGIPTFRNSEIKDMYLRAIREGWHDQIFHDGSITNADAFVQYITGTGVLFWGIYHENDLMGFVWANRIEKTHCYCHFGFFKKWWGRDSILTRTGKQFMDMLLIQKYPKETMFDLVLGMYPSTNTHVTAFMKRLGARQFVEIPNLIYDNVNDKSIDGTIVVTTREDLK